MPTAPTELDATPVVPLRRNRDFQLLWSGRAVSALGTEVTAIAYPLIMLAITGSAGYAGMLGTAQLLTALVATLPAGLLADRVNRRTIMIVSDLARAAALGGLALAIYTGHASIPVIIGTAIVSSLFGALFNPASGAALKQLVPVSQMADAQAQNQARGFGAGLIGPPIGGWLLSLGHAVPFLADAISYLVGAFALLFIRTPLQEKRTGPAQQLGWRDMTAGLKHVFAMPTMRMLMMWAMGINLAFSGFMLVLIATWHQRGATPSQIGLLSSLSIVGGLLGAILSGRVIKWTRPSQLVWGLAFALPVLLLAMGFVPGVVPIALLCMASTFFLPALNSIAFTYLAAWTPDDLQGRANAGINVLAMALQPLGPILMGTIFDQGGPFWAFLSMAVVCVVAAVPVFSKHLRNLPRPEELAEE